MNLFGSWKDKIQTTFAKLFLIFLIFIGLLLNAGVALLAFFCIPVSALAVLTTAIGSTIGTAIAMYGLTILVKMAEVSDDDPETQKWEIALEKNQQELMQKNSELEQSKLLLTQKELELKEKTNELSKTRAELSHLKDMNIQISMIQPAFKLITGEARFNITDFYEKEVSHSEIEKSWLPGKEKPYRQDRKIYRGVMQYSGILNLGVDLKNLNVYENGNDLIIYGSLSNFSSFSDLRDEWRLLGRVETETWLGEKEDSLQLKSVIVDISQDSAHEYEEQQRKMLLDKLKNSDIIKSFKFALDEAAKKFITTLLKPTGKNIRFEEQLPQTLENSTCQLGTIIDRHNESVKLLYGGTSKNKN